MPLSLPSLPVALLLPPLLARLPLLLLALAPAVHPSPALELHPVTLVPSRLLLPSCLVLLVLLSLLSCRADVSTQARCGTSHIATMTQNHYLRAVLSRSVQVRIVDTLRHKTSVYNLSTLLPSRCCFELHILFNFQQSVMVECMHIPFHLCHLEIWRAHFFLRT